MSHAGGAATCARAKPPAIAARHSVERHSESTPTTRVATYMVRLLGIDPGLRFTGWGLIEPDGNRLRHCADGVIATDAATPVPERLRVLHDALAALLAEYQPNEAAIEETYVNRNGSATLKLGYARGG